MSYVFLESQFIFFLLTLGTHLIQNETQTFRIRTGRDEGKIILNYELQVIMRLHYSVKKKWVF